MLMERLTFSLYVTVIGLVVVFVVLIILIAFAKLTVFANLIPSREDMKKKRKAKKQVTLAEKAEAAAEKTPVVSAPAVPANTDTDEIQAVIAAAIAAYMAEVPASAVCPNGIVVRSVRRTGSFNAASRYERMNNRI